MNHLENLQKLHKTLCEKLKETDERRDYERKHGSVGAAENLADECRELNEAIESLEWGIETAKEVEKMYISYDVEELDYIMNEHRKNKETFVWLISTLWNKAYFLGCTDGSKINNA